jgi:hypothetical protein
LYGKQLESNKVQNVLFGSKHQATKCRKKKINLIIFVDEAALDDSILPLREMFETLLSVAVALTKYGIEEFHLQEVKSLNHQQKLIHAKLAFSLEQIILIAKLALESKNVEDCEASKSIRVIALRYCIRCFQTLLSDSNTQVNDM